MTVRTIEEHPAGISWVVEEPLTRASHALAHEGRVWLVDPVHEPEALDRARALGQPAGVLQLLDRHNRDCQSIAARLGVPHLRQPKALPGTPFEPIGVVRTRFWSEVALWWPERRALVVAEAVGTNPMFAVGGAALGVHVLLRATPPRRLDRYAPEHLLVGHGAGLHGPGAARALSDALGRSRRDLPRALLRLPTALRG